MTDYKPEGRLIGLPENISAMKSLQTLGEAYAQGRILEARALVCTREHDLTVDLGCMRGMIPKNEGALGISEGKTKDISMISRVNKPVAFKIIGFESQGGETVAILSRRLAQEECFENYLSGVRPGDVLPAQVTRLEKFGAFVDIGCGISSLIPIDMISVSRISHPSDRFYPGQHIFAAVRENDGEGRISLSHKELLGTWEENAEAFSAGETVAGTVRSVEDYGLFIELAPNLAGLAEPREDACIGQRTSVYIKSIIPEKMKIKLIVVDCFDASYTEPEPVYRITEGHISSWRYSPLCCEKVIGTVFDAE